MPDHVGHTSRATARWRPEMSRPRPCDPQVVIAGGGIVGWSAAAALKRRLPVLSVTIVARPAGRRRARRPDHRTLPSIVEFHATSAHRVADTIASGRQRLPARHLLRGLGRGPAGLRPRLWRIWPAVRHRLLPPALGARAAASRGQRRSTAIRPPRRSARAGRFVHPSRDRRWRDIAYGLQISPPRYREMMRAYARHLGVVEVARRRSPTSG